MTEQDQTPRPDQDTTGHARRDTEDTTSDDTTGHARRDTEDTTSDDTESPGYYHGG